MCHSYQHPFLFLGKQYRILLRTYLDSFFLGGSFCLLSPLLPALREGSAHRYFSWLTDTLSALAASISNTQSSDLMDGSRTQDSRVCAVQAVCGYCFLVLSDEREDLTVKQTIFKYFCIPVLTSCSPYVLTTLLCAPWITLKVNLSGYPSGDNVSVVKRLFEITQKETKTSDSVYTVNGLLYLQTCCYKLIEVAYDKCSLSSLKGSIAKAFSGATTLMVY